MKCPECEENMFPHNDGFICPCHNHIYYSKKEDEKQKKIAEMKKEYI